MIASAAIVATPSSGTVPPETPMKTSAPASASASEPVRPKWSAVSPASARLTGVQVVARGVQDALAVGDREVPMPASSRILATATPAAPAPEMTTRWSPGRGR